MKFGILIHRPARTVTVVLFVVVVAVGVALRLTDLTAYPPALYPDEALYGTLALRGWATGDFHVYYPLGHSGEGLLVWIDAPLIALLGTQPWVLRVQPAIVGCLSLVAMWGGTVEFARNYVRPGLVVPFKTETVIALFAVLFLACSSWAVHLSRFGVRAYYVPFFTILVLWTLMAARRRASNTLYALCGAVTGLAQYTYPSARVLPAIVGGIFLLDLLPARSLRRRLLGNESPRFGWVAALIWVGAFAAVVAPLAIYFANHLGEFLIRYDEIGVTAAGSPVLQLWSSVYRTAQSLFFFGDGNWRQNVSGAPLLHPFVAVLLLAGMVEAGRGFAAGADANATVSRFGTMLLALTIVVMSLPAVLTTEGVPHALRSSGMLVPILIFAAIGAASWLGRLLPPGAGPERRIGVAFGVALAAAMLAQSTVFEYFWLWGPNPKTRDAFFGDLTDLANEIDRLPPTLEKYVVSDQESLPGDDAWMVQPIEFITGTATSQAQQRRHLQYLNIADLHRSTTLSDHGLYVLIDGARAQHEWLQQRFPDARICGWIKPVTTWSDWRRKASTTPGESNIVLPLANNCQDSDDLE